MLNTFRESSVFYTAFAFLWLIECNKLSKLIKYLTIELNRYSTYSTHYPINSFNLLNSINLLNSLHTEIA